MNNLNDTPPAQSGKPFERVSVLNIIGYSLSAAWILSIFYSVYFYTRTSDILSSIYLNQFVSQLALVIGMAVLFVAGTRLSKWTLSKPVITVACSTLAASTLVLLTNWLSPGFSSLMIVISAVLSGLSSAVLFVAWMRLLADSGARAAVIELCAAYILAAILSMVLQYLPPIASCIITSLFAAGSGVALYVACAKRRPRLKVQPVKTPPDRLRGVVSRGLFGCFCFGLVAGFTDILSGITSVGISIYYSLILMAVIVILLAIALLLAVFQREFFAIYIDRMAFLAVIIGCFLLVLVSGEMQIQNALINAGYICFLVVAVGVGIDISNYYQIPASRIVVSILLALFVGELSGYVLGLAIDNLYFEVFPMQTIAFLLCGILLTVSLFLFTEKDLLQERLGRLFSTTYDTQNKASDSLENASEWVADIADKMSETYNLTTRESEILPQLLRGRTIARMQEALHISAGTVHTHIRHIYYKLGITNRQELLDLIEKQMDAKAEQ